MQRHILSEKDAKRFKMEIKAKYGVEIDGKIEEGREKKEIMYLINDMISFIGEEKIPTLCFIMKFHVSLPYVIIDEGAAKAVSQGADLFVPGIQSYECECKSGDIVLVKTKNEIPIAIMKALMSKEEAIEKKKGKFAENLHYIGDKYWEMCRKYI